MAVRRKTYAFRKNAIVEVEEFHDGNYGKPGVRRKQRNSPTEKISRERTPGRRRSGADTDSWNISHRVT